MNERDEGYLQDMLEATEKILLRTRGLRKNQYDADEDKQIVFTHLVQIIGEAASRVSQTTREAYQQIPWAQIIGTRHRVVHDYINVDTEILWEIVTVQIPELRTELLQIIPLDSDENGEEQNDAEDA
ncbi:MAG: HepT-like ribonuclease domain-containing protein [Planctomycetaceae bacterium]